jgi:hypothetical protein
MLSQYYHLSQFETALTVNINGQPRNSKIIFCVCVLMVKIFQEAELGNTDHETFHISGL